MAAEQRPEDALEPTGESPGRESGEEALAVASSREPPHSTEEPATDTDTDEADTDDADADDADADDAEANADDAETGAEGAWEGDHGAGSDDGAGLQVQLDLEELEARAQRADEYLALAQRTQADFDNYRKRAARDVRLAQDRGVAKLAKELLPAIDNLDRALQAAGEEQSPLAEGIRFVQSDLLSALARLGVEPFSPSGEPFDPQLHEAVAQQPVDGVESGTVAEVFQQGFRLGDSVLRPARVLVAA